MQISLEKFFPSFFVNKGEQFQYVLVAFQHEGTEFPGIFIGSDSIFVLVPDILGMPAYHLIAVCLQCQQFTDIRQGKAIVFRTVARFAHRSKVRTVAESE